MRWSKKTYHNVNSVSEQVSDALRSLTPLFKSHVNLSFMMTDPTCPNAYIVISNEDPDVLIAAINASRKPFHKTDGI